MGHALTRLCPRTERNVAEPSSLDALVQALRLLPGVGAKTASRMAFHLLQHDRAGALVLARALNDASSHVRHCERCHTFTEAEVCSTCTDPSDKRNKVVRLTDKAKDINLEIRRSIDNGERAMLKSFSEEEVEQLRGYLIRICDNLDIDSSPGCKPESGAKKEKRE